MESSGLHKPVLNDSNEDTQIMRKIQFENPCKFTTPSEQIRLETFK